LLTRPDILVLGGGGVLGEAWMTGVLAGIEDATAFDLRDCEYFVGTSAGSIVASRLVAGGTPRRPGEPAPESESATQSAADPAETALAVAARRAARRASRWAIAAGAPLAPLALNATRPGGALVRAALLRRIPRPSGSLQRLRRDIERSGARFDGRLRVTAVDRRSGRRVIFGSPGAPRATVAEAVEASCTVPWLFEPVTIGGREYVDGGVWSATNLDAAPAGRDTHVVCLNPTAGIHSSRGLVGVARSYSRSAVSFEAVVLRRRGAIVEAFGPDDAAAVLMSPDFMNREPRERVLAAGYRQGRSIADAPQGRGRGARATGARDELSGLSTTPRH
jgi:NTE family protein